MKKLTRVAGIVLLMAAVCYTGLASGLSIVNNPMLGFFTNGSVATLTKLVPGAGIITYEVANTIGGVIFQATAVPAGNAVGKPVAIQYNPAQPDGRRLSLTIGGKAVKVNLYDWEIIPVARFVESGYTACMTLFDEPRGGERVTPIENMDKGIMWANFHPAFGDTLTGLNLFFADAMFVNPGLMQFADFAFTFPVPGYHKTRLNWLDTNKDYRRLHFQMMHEKLSLKQEKQNTYIYTDYETEISYRIRNRRIVFFGVPQYLFMYKDDDNETVTVAEEMNKAFAALHKDVYRINPTVYGAAEKAAQWAAFFRMVQAEYPQAWQGFMKQIDGIDPAPKVETPRYWLSSTMID
jgi:hypothetical protein